MDSKCAFGLWFIGICRIFALSFLFSFCSQFLRSIKVCPLLSVDPPPKKAAFLKPPLCTLNSSKSFPFDCPVWYLSWILDLFSVFTWQIRLACFFPSFLCCCFFNLFFPSTLSYHTLSFAPFLFLGEAPHSCLSHCSHGLCGWALWNWVFFYSEKISYFYYTSSLLKASILFVYIVLCMLFQWIENFRFKQLLLIF